MDWSKIELTVYDLQRKIYDHTKLGETKRVQKYQRKLVKTDEARLLAVRRITQDNTGRATAGIDGVKSIKQEYRYKLSKELVFDGSASKIRRVIIPKRNGKSRPLGIPTIKDRCKQMLMKMAIEPE